MRAGVKVDMIGAKFGCGVFGVIDIPFSDFDCPVSWDYDFIHAVQYTACGE
jgi:hypothetical protein